MYHLIVNNNIYNLNNLKKVYELEDRYIIQSNINIYKNYIFINYLNVINIYYNLKKKNYYNFENKITHSKNYNLMLYIGFSNGDLIKFDVKNNKILKKINLVHHIEIFKILNNKIYVLIFNKLIIFDLNLNIINKYNENILHFEFWNENIIYSTMYGSIVIRELNNFKLIKEIELDSLVINFKLFHNSIVLYFTNKNVVKYSLVNYKYLTSILDRYMINEDYELIYDKDKMNLYYHNKYFKSFSINYTYIFQAYIKRNILFLEYYESGNGKLLIYNLKNNININIKKQITGYECDIFNLEWNLKNRELFSSINKMVDLLIEKYNNLDLVNNILKYI
jgi:hypothetical protein